MQSSKLSHRRISSAATLVALSLLAGTSARAETWVGGTSTDFNDASNWTPASVPNSGTASADFNTKDITGIESVVLSSGVTLNSLTFGDAAGADGTYNLSGAGFALGGTTPTITVNGTLNDAVTIANAISGSTGLVKSGSGTLKLTANSSFTGGITVNGGVLDTSAGTQILTRQFITLTNGGTWKFASGNSNATFAPGLGGSTGQPPTFVAASGGLQVAAGQTGTITNVGDVSIGQVGGGAGSTLNVVVASGSTFNARGSWQSTTTANTGGQLGALNISTAGTGSFVLVSNISGNQDRFASGTNTSVAFQNTAVDIGSGITFSARTGSSGNSYTFGSLSGGSTAVLYGGRAAGGGEAAYTVGGLNTNTTFAGTIKSEVTDTPTALGGINITKVGTGTLTLSGSLTYQASTSATFARKGGVMTVSAGTLALSNAAAIPAGVSATQQTTLDIRSGTTVDVSGTTNTFTDNSSNTVTGYSTSALSQVIGAGTIKGTFNHANGVLAPGNTMGTSTSIYNNPVAGTLAVNGKMYFMGSGSIPFDITPSTSSGNDLITVTDGDLSGTPTLAINRIGGASAGNYTIISSTNNLVGSATGWTVTWQGRGTTPTLDWTTDPKKLQLVVSASSLGGSVNWSGLTNGTWDINSTTNFYNTATSSADKYFDGDNVSFLDLYDGVNAVSNPSITLGSTVSPTAVVFNSSATNYSISGAGKISGATSLIKQGTSTLTLSTANDYTGGTTISGGGAIVGQIGTGALTLNNGSFTNTVNNATTPAVTVTAASTNTITTSGTGTSTIGALSGSGMITIANSAGTTDVTGNNSAFTGTLGVAGTVRVAGATSIGAANAVVINSGVLQTNQASTGSNDIGSLAGTGGSLTGFQGGSTPASGTVRTWNIGALNTNTQFDGTITNGKSPSITAITKVGTGTLTLTGSNGYTGATTINGGTLQIGNGGTSGEIALLGAPIVDNASLVFNRSDSPIIGPNISGTGSVSVIGTGTTSMFSVLTTTGPTNVSNGRLIMMSESIHNNAPLNVTSGGVVEMPLNGGQTWVTSVAALNISGTGSHIELHDNDLVSNYGAGPSNYATIVSKVKSGLVLLGGTGTEGISSGEVDAQTVQGTILAVVDDGDANIGGAITATSGFTIPSPTTSTIVKFTWFGDSNLDGQVDGSDYALLDSGFTSGGALGGWVFGDYDYSGTVDGSDYALIDTGFISQNAVLPEPTTLGLLGLGAMGMIRRRRQA